MQAGIWRRHRWLKWIGGGLLAAFAVLTGAVLVLAHRAEPIMRAYIVQGLRDHFHARVELDSFHLTLRNGLWAEGKGLRIWPPAEVEGVGMPGFAGPPTPLIRLNEFRFHAPLHYDPRQAIRISVVQLKGLDVDMPPRPHFEHSAKGTAAVPATAGARLLRFQVDSLECNGAHLTVETSKPGKLPLEFAIAHLTLTGIHTGGPMNFDAELTNPRPVGTIHTRGSLGPWLVADPGESPIVGDYRFEHADLSGFKGIAGIMNSTGHYQGTLRDMVVDGETDTPDFQLTLFDTALPLHTKFHAYVDGTNGDTQLQPVEATLGHSHFWTQGQIVRAAATVGGKYGPRPGGHDIALTIDVDRGRIEDFLRLVSRSGTPLLTGALTMKAGLEIPPGPVPVHERLKLTGTFTLDDAQFTSPKIQDRIREMSARGQGRPKDAKASGDDEVRSTMKGDFQMASGVVTLPALEYTVPGAVIDLKGTYGVEGGVLNFAGTAKMQATVSAMVGGWKGLLLKPVDRYFQKDGAGTEVPIHINGTRADPQFGIDFNRMKGSSAQRPDQPQ
ncbi:MAG TPA: AsmA-like C-terminal region-containing protein [Terracidiphilus sp.]|nr:AsmA-like C-terminal region-containing protein [Terracidiphilus sp.]